MPDQAPQSNPHAVRVPLEAIKALVEVDRDYEERIAAANRDRNSPLSYELALWKRQSLHRERHAHDLTFLIARYIVDQEAARIAAQEHA